MAPGFKIVDILTVLGVIDLSSKFRSERVDVYCRLVAVFIHLIT